MLGCSSDDEGRHTGKHDIWFMGAVTNGATGAPLTDYTITLVSGNSRTQGKVDATTGRYVVGPLQAWNDYGVIIDGGPDYRPFSSYNAGIAPPSPGNQALSSDIYMADTTQTFNFDASLFPLAVTPPDLTVGIFESGANAKPASGSIRLQPTSQPTIQSQPSEVAGQIWTNDNDLYTGVVSGMFTNGSYVVTGDKLVYGVTYAITTYGVEGFQPSGPTNAQAGNTTLVTIQLSPVTTAPLQLISSTASTCKVPAALTDTTSAVVTLTFNQPLEDATTTAGGAAEIIDNGLSITTALGTSALATSVSATAQERGGSFTIADNVVTLSWNPNVGLATKGAGDIIRGVSYTNLNAVLLQPKGRSGTTPVSLYQLIGGLTSITCTAM
jgi:hypothetical protein